MTKARHVKIRDLTLGNDRPLAVIAGPCALESREHAHEMCQALKELTAEIGIGLKAKLERDRLRGIVFDPQGFVKLPPPQQPAPEQVDFRPRHEPVV